MDLYADTSNRASKGAAAAWGWGTGKVGDVVAIDNPLDTISTAAGAAFDKASGFALDVYDRVGDGVENLTTAVKWGAAAYVASALGAAVSLYFLLRGGVIAAIADSLRSLTSLFLGG